ncbi:MAG: ABC transporter ATP-binding protein [Promethearchaeota archaeon]
MSNAEKMEKMEEMENMVVVDHLVKHFDEVKAVDDISFNIKKGEIFGLLGPNGAGKTTTVKLMLGLLEANQGNITILGLDPEKDEVALKSQLGYVSEEPLIYKSLTPKELFNFIASIRRLDGEKVTGKLAQYLESLDAIEYYERLISTLSRGNKQKIQIIAAILHDPDLLIMDEPLAGLDAKSVKVVKEILELHIERGGSVLFSTHIMEIAEDICDRIAIINRGKIVSMGTFAELRLVAKDMDGVMDLEDVFLRLTEQDESVKDIISKLRSTMNSHRGS